MYVYDVVFSYGGGATSAPPSPPPTSCTLEQCYQTWSPIQLANSRIGRLWPSPEILRARQKSVDVGITT